ncbi:hypothetical protein FRC17_001049 [Serendipita sp. 399]|nr:hypothetical protein FRC17_001049 [Serendipita sp. 399]
MATPNPPVPYELVPMLERNNHYAANNNLPHSHSYSNAPAGDPLLAYPPRPGFFNASSTTPSTFSSTSTLNVGYYDSKQHGGNDGLYLEHPTDQQRRQPPSSIGVLGVEDSGSAAFGGGEKGRKLGRETTRRRPRRNCVTTSLAIAGCCLLVLAAILVPVYFFVLRDHFKDHTANDAGTNHNNNQNSNSENSNSGTNDEGPRVVTTGGDGSIVTKEDGSTFIYNNTFGGFWVFDPSNPLNESAQAQSWTKPLSQQWQYGVDKIYGVNLGGWLNIEPFISPALYEFFPNAVDEWTLSELLQAKYGNLEVIENHYKTFIVEEDFAQIAAAGLNWVRIPFPFWGIEKYANEPFLERACWPYFLKAIEWARKYGIRINLDLHALPGSQNGWNHSGKLGVNGEFNFMRGVMGIANAQRAMDYIRILAEFISQPEYKNVVPFFGIVNEPFSNTVGSYPKSAIEAFYAEAYRVIRNAGGTGAGNGPMISIHHAFYGPAKWEGFLQGSDRIAMDLHPYLVFDDGPASADPPSAFPAKACAWASEVAASMTNFGLTAAGEWSVAINDCGLFVNEVGKGTRYEGTYKSNVTIGSCEPWNDWASWDDTIKESLRQLSLASMDALQNWFFWTWKIGESVQTGTVRAPFWSYKLGLEHGWMPLDPRESSSASGGGMCAQVGVPITRFSGALQAWQVGGSGAGENVVGLESYPWPPTAIGGFADASRLPRYTPTGPIVTLPVKTYTDPAHGAGHTNAIPVGDGWTNDADQMLMAVPQAGCDYPDQWDALTAAVPTCGGGMNTKRAEPTPVPML